MITDRMHIACTTPERYHMTKEEIREELKELENNPNMITKSFYSPTAVEWPDNRLPFVEYHMAHLTNHKLTDPRNYLSNLKLMIIKR